MTDYPQVLPLEAAQLCLEIVKGRAIAARKQEFGLAAWNVQGYIQRVTLGVPTLPGDADPEDVIPQIEEAIFALEEAIYEYEGEGVELSYGAPDDEDNDDDEAGSIVTILAIISVVVQLIQLWRNREEKDLPGNDMDGRNIWGE